MRPVVHIVKLSAIAAGGSSALQDNGHDHGDANAHAVCDGNQVMKSDLVWLSHKVADFWRVRLAYELIVLVSAR